jgi:hypothetical protein
VVLGSGKQGPDAAEVFQVLKNPAENVVVNLVGLPLADRPPFFLKLFNRLGELRARTARPHWLVVDEAHHLLPASWEPGVSALPLELDRMVLITVHPDQVARAVLKPVSTIVAVGASPDKTLAQFCEAVGTRPRRLASATPEAGEVLVWRRGEDEPPFLLRAAPSKTERLRHSRKYAEGELPPDRSFYFRGPEGKLNLRAQNLILFMQLGDGVDDATWTYHLKQRDYSRWFRERIKDDALAADAEQVEGQIGLPPAESRRRIREAIERRYTLPASTPLPMPGTDAAPGGS